MKLKEAVSEYVKLKQCLGMCFGSNANVLKWFCRRFEDYDLEDVDSERVQTLLTGRGGFRHWWYHTLKGFYRFAMSRGYVDTSPLPTRIPKERRLFVPYIYSMEEIKRLLAATPTLDRPQNQNRLQGLAFRTLLLLLYGTGLRISEALNLTLSDVDLETGVITVRDSKFYKSRLVPIGPKLIQALLNYKHARCNQLPLPYGRQSAFFATLTGNRIFHGHVRNVFWRLRRLTGIRRDGGPRWQPRIHDLRHTFAVHRLVAWYREGANVQRILPLLSTYLGHVNIAATQRYLTMTPELLREANRRFEHFAFAKEEDNEYKSYWTLDPSIPFRTLGQRAKLGSKHPGQLPRYHKAVSSFRGRKHTKGS